MAWKGNPENPAPNQQNNSDAVADKKETVNRATKIRRDTDELNNFTVTLLDIDTAIFEYIDKQINLTVEDNGENVKVPILYGSPERWKAIQADGAIRDNNGKLQLPAIMFKRNSVAKNPALATLNRHLNVPVLQKFSEKNKYDKFSLMTKTSAPVAQVLNVTLPDHVTLTYEFMLWTEYVEQMNVLIEKINWASEEYWGDPKKFKFRVYIEDYSNNTEVSSGKDRMVRTTFTMKVQAYLLADSFENKKLTTTKTLTPRKIIIGQEYVDGIQMSSIKKDINDISNKKPFPYSQYDNVIKPDNFDYTPPKISSTEPTSTSKTPTISGNIVSIRNSYKSLASANNQMWHNPPANESSYGEEGWMAYDENYHYIYVNGKWLRQPLNNFQSF